jgi:hypothetical protein
MPAKIDHACASGRDFDVAIADLHAASTGQSGEPQRACRQLRPQLLLPSLHTHENTVGGRWLAFSALTQPANVERARRRAHTGCSPHSVRRGAALSPPRAHSRGLTVFESHHAQLRARTAETRGVVAWRAGDSARCEWSRGAG